MTKKQLIWELIQLQQFYGFDAFSFGIQCLEDEGFFALQCEKHGLNNECLYSMLDVDFSQIINKAK